MTSLDACPVITHLCSGAPPPSPPCFRECFGDVDTVANFSSLVKITQFFGQRASWKIRHIIENEKLLQDCSITNLSVSVRIMSNCEYKEALSDSHLTMA